MSMFVFRIGSMAVLLVTIALTVITTPIAAEAQQATRVYRLGILQSTVPRVSSDPTAFANQIMIPCAHWGRRCLAKFSRTIFMAAGDST